MYGLGEVLVELGKLLGSIVWGLTGLAVQVMVIAVLLGLIVAVVRVSI